MWALIYMREDGDPGRHPFGMERDHGEGGVMGFVWDVIDKDQPGILLETGWTREDLATEHRG